MLYAVMFKVYTVYYIRDGKSCLLPCCRQDCLCTLIVLGVRLPLLIFAWVFFRLICGLFHFCPSRDFCRAHMGVHQSKWAFYHQQTVMQLLHVVAGNHQCATGGPNQPHLIDEECPRLMNTHLCRAETLFDCSTSALFATLAALTCVTLELRILGLFISPCVLNLGNFSQIVTAKQSRAK